jgi:hypothetical protein
MLKNGQIGVKKSRQRRAKAASGPGKVIQAVDVGGVRRRQGSRAGGGVL